MFLIAAALATLITGSFGYFVFLFIAHILFPKTTQYFLVFIISLCVWGGSTIFLFIFGWITGLLPSFMLCSLITAYPSYLFVKSCIS
jgi:hypothetical protein